MIVKGNFINGNKQSNYYGENNFGKQVISPFRNTPNLDSKYSHSAKFP